MKILNFGSLNWDKVYQVPHFVQEGETLSATELRQFPGGKGLNQSIALGRAGAEASHAGAVGTDGAPFLELLRQANVDVKNVRMLTGESGHAIIQSCRGQNCIIVSGGTNRQLQPSDVDGFLAEFCPGDLLLVQNETSCVGHAIRRAREMGMRVALNPSPLDEAILQAPLEAVDIFLLNEIEGRSLAPDAGDAPEEILAALARRFPRALIVLTLGGAGSLCRSGTQTLRQEAFRVPVTDTTAAGDTFCGYFLAALAQGLPLQNCLRRASLAAALAVTRPGACPSIPTLQEVLDFGRQC